ncbi:MAG TPA: translation initiation factor IF-2 N-terminal domain-containing protein, partial [Terriglobia bacterium]|nr:translation initiation factor IF-2 N-terminal domain-containing protein [Terriglobia bacterium]
MRINELARELEVKAKAIIDYLAEIGVEGKRSHSSTIEEELVEKVKAHFRAEAASQPPAPPAAPAPAPEPQAKPAPLKPVVHAETPKEKAAPPREVASE